MQFSQFETYPQHDAATTILHSRDGVLWVMCCVGFAANFPVVNEIRQQKVKILNVGVDFIFFSIGTVFFKTP